MAIVKQGLHQLSKHSQKQWILLYVLTQISFMLLVNTVHVLLSVFNIKQQNHTKGLKLPFSWLCSDSELPSNSQVKHTTVFTPFMSVSCVLQLLQERSNSVFLGRLNLQHISLSLTPFLQWPIKEFNIKGIPGLLFS